MYFDFEGRGTEQVSLDSAMSWREQILMSLFVHALVILTLLFIPSLPFARQAREAQALRLAELNEQQQNVPPPLSGADNSRTFVFIEPRLDIEATEDPRPDAPFSDRDRLAQSQTQAEDPLNTLPNAEGNSSSFVESDDPSIGEDEDRFGFLADESTPEPEETESEELEDVTEPQEDELAELEQEPNQETVEASNSPERIGESLTDEFIARAIEDGALVPPGDGRDDPDAEATDLLRSPDGLLGRARAMRNLDRYVRRESFANRSGSSGRFGPSLQFDSKGVEFGPWVRRFVAQIRRNWFVPYAMMARSLHGNVVITFYVNRDGSISELSVIKPANIDAFTNSAFNALSTSNPTQPLPPEYPDERAFFTVTFYFNESPPV